jgi:hypothetical protein
MMCYYGRISFGYMQVNEISKDEENCDITHCERRCRGSRRRLTSRARQEGHGPSRFAALVEIPNAVPVAHPRIIDNNTLISV